MEIGLMSKKQKPDQWGEKQLKATKRSNMPYWYLRISRGHSISIKKIVYLYLHFYHLSKIKSKESASILINDLLWTTEDLHGEKKFMAQNIFPCIIGKNSRKSEQLTKIP